MLFLPLFHTIIMAGEGDDCGLFSLSSSSPHSPFSRLNDIPRHGHMMGTTFFLFFFKKKTIITTLVALLLNFSTYYT